MRIVRLRIVFWTILWQDEGSEEIVRSSTNSPPFRGWNGDPRSLPSREPGIGGYQALGPRAPPPPPRGLPFGPPLTASQGFSAPPWRDSSINPIGTGVGRTDRQIGPLEVAVTTGTTTTVCRLFCTTSPHSRVIREPPSRFQGPDVQG